MNKKTLTVLESILEDDSILSTMTAEQQAALEEAVDEFYAMDKVQEFYVKGDMQ